MTVHELIDELNQLTEEEQLLDVVVVCHADRCKYFRTPVIEEERRAVYVNLEYGIYGVHDKCKKFISL